MNDVEHGIEGIHVSIIMRCHCSGKTKSKGGHSKLKIESQNILKLNIGIMLYHSGYNKYTM